MMRYRYRSAKPTTALWLFVALADVALVAASAGVLVWLLTGATLLGGGAAGTWLAHRRFRQTPPARTRMS